MPEPDCGCASRGTQPGHTPDHLETRAAVDNSAWDGPAAMSACSNSDTPASCFGSICAGKKAGDTSTQAAWALPHHKHPGDPPNANGVANAQARIGSTQGLTNKAQAQAHLDAHTATINANKSATPANGRAAAGRARRMATREGMGRVAAARAAALTGAGRAGRRDIPNPGGRAQGFGGQILAAPTMKDGAQYYELEGTASVVGQPYEMYDMFGPYDEIIAAGAFDESLANPDLDVAFLVNHRGVTMARIKNGSLDVWASPDLACRAFVNAARQDVRDLVSAISDGLIDEMSFAFWLLDGEWSEDYMTFTITRADINRGDVSAVNYGANPYTSIAARSGQILEELDRMPAGAARAAVDILLARADLADPDGTGWMPPAGRVQRGSETPAPAMAGAGPVGYRAGGHVYAPEDVEVLSDWGERGTPEGLFPEPGSKPRSGKSLQMLALEFEQDNELDG